MGVAVSYHTSQPTQQAGSQSAREPRIKNDENGTARSSRLLLAFDRLRVGHPAHGVARFHPSVTRGALPSIMFSAFD